MPLSDPASLSFSWSFHLTNAFRRCGVCNAFISPGSRSTPLTLALAHHPGITCHSVLDERSSAFMALGAGKHSGTPALFVCTSGTAVANAYPAVIEARMSATPLIVLSADRPPNLRAIGASQTIDQIKIFGDYPLFSFDTGEPVDSPADFARLGRLANQAYDHAATVGGPVHLNLPFRKPLEPSRDQIRRCVAHYCHSECITVESENVSMKSNNTTVKSENTTSMTGDTFLHPPFTPSVAMSGDLQPIPLTLQKMINNSRRPLVIAGPALRLSDRLGITKVLRQGTSPDTRPNVRSYSAFFDWCRRSHIPVLSETGGIPGGITRHPFLLKLGTDADSLKRGTDADFLQPDLILRIGGSPVHQPTLKALQAWQAPQIVFGEHRDQPDATLSATHRVSGPALNYDWKSFQPKSSFETYHEEWCRLDAQVALKQRSRLEAEKQFGDGHVYARLLPLLRSEPDLQIVLSNSFAIRDYPLFSPDEDASRFPVLTNRGASGIDGVTSTAIGAALAGKKSTILITGDLAFLHDITALNNLHSRRLSLKIVVVNNKGGIIFRMLPFEHRDDIYNDFIETPQQVTIPYLARAHGIACESVNSVDGLEKAWNRLSGHLVGILECRTDADASMRLRSTL